MAPLTVILLSLTTLLTTTQATTHIGLPLPFHLIRPMLDCTASAHRLHGISCQSWRLAVETNNIKDWKTVPASCEDYIGHYMLGDRYRKDSKVVADEAIGYAKGVELGGDRKDAWVFDVDETILSNLPYYAQHGFGTTPYNASLFDAWVDLGKVPALPESLRLYKKLITLGVKVVFLTGRDEIRRKVTVLNLKRAGYPTWDKLILRGEDQKGQSAVVYKSGERKKLVEGGYTIIGNIGDQWSDILGSPEGDRTFKLPDPMYYIA